jgi:DNA ligase-1
MRFSELGMISRATAATRSRLEKRALLAGLLGRASGDDVRLAVSYLAGILPQGRIGVGPSQLRDALGDLTDDAPVDDALTLSDVDRLLGDIGAVCGAGSKARRRDLLGALFAEVIPDDRHFLAGLILGELRQGALESALLDALADATGIDAARVRRAAMLAGNPADVADVAFREGASGLDRFRLEPMTPVKPMLAQPAETMADAIASIPDAVIEYKLDGARVQVHRDGDAIRVYSRQLNDVTAAVPDIVDKVESLDARRLVLDGEAIALRDDGRPLPFQVTMRRFGRKAASDEAVAALPLSLFLFDCLLVDDRPLIDAPYAERREALAGLAPSSLLAPQLRTGDIAAASAFLSGALELGHEGVMVKAPGSLYAAGNRGADWLKVKHVHTLDLVVLAAEWGSGRRKGWLSNLHLGARQGDGFVMLGKTFKGLTDKTLKWQTDALLALETRRDTNTVYVRPELVVEIAVNETLHLAAEGAGLRHRAQPARAAGRHRARPRRRWAERSPAAAGGDPHRRYAGARAPAAAEGAGGDPGDHAGVAVSAAGLAGGGAPGLGAHHHRRRGACAGGDQARRAPGAVAGAAGARWWRRPRAAPTRSASACPPPWSRWRGGALARRRPPVEIVDAAAPPRLDLTRHACRCRTWSTRRRPRAWPRRAARSSASSMPARWRARRPRRASGRRSIRPCWTRSCPSLHHRLRQQPRPVRAAVPAPERGRGRLRPGRGRCTGGRRSPAPRSG